MRAPKDKVESIPAVASNPVKPNEKKKGGFTILSVGRFVEMKGFDIAIKSFAKFVLSVPQEQRESVKLKLLGKGEYSDFLKKLAKELKVEKYVEFVSWVEKTEMHDIYSQSDIYLFPSHEGAGMVVPEAMSYGLPVITFDNVGPGELQKDAGIKVPYSTYDKAVEDFANALKTLFDSPGQRLRLSINSSLTFKESYTWNKKIEAILKIYDDCLPDEMVASITNPIPHKI
jgi:glycosyltransferase involved in cell wall biosynthesis